MKTKCCLVCNAEFTVSDSIADKRKTCSNKCKYELKTSRTIAARTHTCPVCLTEFVVDIQKSQRVYCSSACFGKAKTNRIIKTCERCGKEFSVIQARSDARFCSQPCMSFKVEKSCIVCGQVFYIKPSHAHKRHTCSRACLGKFKSMEAKAGRAPNQGVPLTPERKQKVSAGLIRYFNGDPSKHSNFKNGPFSQRRGVYNKWEAAREQARAKSAYCCAICGAAEPTLDKRLSVHHIKPFRLFASSEEANLPDNLIAVCQSCHMRLERGSIVLLNHTPLP